MWGPEWGVPRRVHLKPKDEAAHWEWKWDRNRSYRDRKYNSLSEEVRMASWPSLDEETWDERAVRLYLKEKGE